MLQLYFYILYYIFYYFFVPRKINFSWLLFDKYGYLVSLMNEFWNNTWLLFYGQELKMEKAVDGFLFVQSSWTKISRRYEPRWCIFMAPCKRSLISLFRAIYISENLIAREKRREKRVFFRKNYLYININKTNHHSRNQCTILCKNFIIFNKKDWKIKFFHKKGMILNFYERVIHSNHKVTFKWVLLGVGHNWLCVCPLL